MRRDCCRRMHARCHRKPSSDGGTRPTIAAQACSCLAQWRSRSLQRRQSADHPPTHAPGRLDRHRARGFTACLCISDRFPARRARGDHRGPARHDQEGASCFPNLRAWRQGSAAWRHDAQTYIHEHIKAGEVTWPPAVSGGTMPLPRRRASQDMHVCCLPRRQRVLSPCLVAGPSWSALASSQGLAP